MFHLDMTFEDYRIIATSKDGITYKTLLNDNLSGESAELNLSADQLHMVVAFNLHPDGTPDGHEHFYEVLEPPVRTATARCPPYPVTQMDAGSP